MIFKAFSCRAVVAWVRRHPTLTGILTMLGCFLLLNILAYRHASAMLNYDSSAVRTASPRALSIGQKAQVLLCGASVPRPTNSRGPADLGLASETVRIKTDDGLSLEGWLLTPDHPRGTILMFHGYSASRSGLLNPSLAFNQMGFATLLVDFRGSGGSDGSATTLGYNEALDVAASWAYARTRKLPQPLVLYGQSMGGAAILRSVSALNVRPEAIIIESVFDEMLKTVRNRFELMGVPSFPGAELLVFWGGVRIGCCGFQHNPVEYARSCDCAALVLHGAQDRNAKCEEGEAVYASLPGRKKLVVFADAGHTSLYDADGKLWKTAVSEFLMPLEDHDKPEGK